MARSQGITAVKLQLLSVNVSVFMTVLKITTDNGSPWNTALLSGKIGVVHSLVVMLGDRPVYNDCTSRQNCGGAW